MNMKSAKKILLVFAITLVYCLIWFGLEIIIYGQIESRIVDDIMMLLFIPVIWKAVENITI